MFLRFGLILPTLQLAAALHNSYLSVQNLPVAEIALQGSAKAPGSPSALPLFLYSGPCAKTPFLLKNQQTPNLHREQPNLTLEGSLLQLESNAKVLQPPNQATSVSRCHVTLPISLLQAQEPWSQHLETSAADHL